MPRGTGGGENGRPKKSYYHFGTKPLKSHLSSNRRYQSCEVDRYGAKLHRIRSRQYRYLYVLSGRDRLVLVIPGAPLTAISHAHGFHAPENSANCSMTVQMNCCIIVPSSMRLSYPAAVPEFMQVRHLRASEASGASPTLDPSGVQAP